MHAPWDQLNSFAEFRDGIEAAHEPKLWNGIGLKDV
jgi:hypothetical protein